MITTVTLNAAVDKTYYLERFAAGQVHRVARQAAEPGGKGNNVAKVIRLLGGEVTSTGIVGGGNGAFIERRLTERGIHTAFIQADEESRVCLNIIDESGGSSTELLEPGPETTMDLIAEIKTKVLQLAALSSVVVLSGSLPAAAPADLYAELIESIHSAGAPAYLDTSGVAFTLGMSALPFLVKPNEQELAAWAGKERLDHNECIQAARQLAGTGIEQVCVTLGSRGAIAIMAGEGYLVTPPRVKAVNTVGCGDSFVAGMAFAGEQGEAPVQRLRIAAAAAAANAMSDRAGHIDYALFKEYVRQVEVKPL
ncbi:1-phosphofructokinase family hexose kinase [Paenibacillus albidus]|uniref:1-phosphofructokinase family hexose kinase n=1 Tax=Paenibacillus albidus TaxID=2041023 RepID=UPI001BEC1129|nr:1-phosphofructokinase family hexose kinase [Paenibacillus albidus]